MIIMSDIYLGDRDIMRCGVEEEISEVGDLSRRTLWEERKDGASFNVSILFRKKNGSWDSNTIHLVLCGVSREIGIGV